MNGDLKKKLEELMNHMKSYGLEFDNKRPFRTELTGYMSHIKMFFKGKIGEEYIVVYYEEKEKYRKVYNINVIASIDFNVEMKFKQPDGMFDLLDQCKKGETCITIAHGENEILKLKRELNECISKSNTLTQSIKDAPSESIEVLKTKMSIEELKSKIVNIISNINTFNEVIDRCKSGLKKTQP